MPGVKRIPLHADLSLSELRRPYEIVVGEETCMPM